MKPRPIPPLPERITLAGGAEYLLPASGSWSLSTPAGDVPMAVGNLSAPRLIHQRGGRIGLDEAGRAALRERVRANKASDTTGERHVVLMNRAIRGWRELDAAAPRRPSSLSPDLCRAMIHFIIARLRRQSPDTVKSYLRAFLHFERWWQEARERLGSKEVNLTPAEVSMETFNAYRLFCVAEGRYAPRHAKRIRIFYAWGVEEGFEGFSADTRDILGALRIPGRRSRMTAIATDPRVGALSRTEQVDIAAALDRGAGDPSARAVVGILRETGIRTRALLLLQETDLVVSSPIVGQSGAPLEPVTRYRLRVPRVKQLNGGGLPSEGRPPLAITDNLGDLLVSLRGDRTPDPARPLIEAIHKAPSGLPWGNKARAVETLLRRWVRESRLRTTRLSVPHGPERGRGASRPLPLMPYRFRRTMAANLAAQGQTPEVIAAALDDTTTEMALVYVGASAQLTDILSDTLDQNREWRRVIGAFAGRLYLAEADEHFPPVIGGAWWLINGLDFMDIGVLGHCATPLPCDRRPPLSCYQCEHFRARRDGDHAQQLEQIRDARQKLRGKESDRVTDVLGATTQAIEEVIRLTRRPRPAVAPGSLDNHAIDPGTRPVSRC